MKRPKPGQSSRTSYPEWEYYLSRLPRWKKTAKDQWVCIFGREHDGFFANQTDAIACGRTKWPGHSFAVFRVGMTEEKVRLSDLRASV